MGYSAAAVVRSREHFLEDHKGISAQSHPRRGHGMLNVEGADAPLPTSRAAAYQRDLPHNSEVGQGVTARAIRSECGAEDIAARIYGGRAQRNTPISAAHYFLIFDRRFGRVASTPTGGCTSTRFFTCLTPLICQAVLAACTEGHCEGQFPNSVTTPFSTVA